MKVIQVNVSGEKIVKAIMDGATVVAITGFGVIAWDLVSVHKKLAKIELLDTRFGKELEEYFHYVDEQNKKFEILKEINKEEA